MQLLLHFKEDSFETLQGFRSWSEDVHIFVIFSKNELISHFSDQSQQKLCILCAQLLLPFYSDCFEILQMFLIMV